MGIRAARPNNHNMAKLKVKSISGLYGLPAGKAVEIDMNSQGDGTPYIWCKIGGTWRNVYLNNDSEIQIVEEAKGNTSNDNESGGVSLRGLLGQDVKTLEFK